MSAIVKLDDQNVVFNALKNSLYVGASNDSIAMVLNYCKAAGLDPMQKPVHIVPIWDNKTRLMRDVVMPGIGLYRTQAARTGLYAGMSEPEFGDDKIEALSGVSITFPAWCRVTVYRLVNGAPVGFTAKEFWKENYAIKGGQDKSLAPNAMWTKRPYAQLAKCAEAQALRKAFPEFGSAPTAEEMEGKIFEHEAVDITPATAPAATKTEAVKSKLAKHAAQPAITLATVTDAIFSAKNPAELAEAAAKAQHLPEQFKAEARAAYAERMAQLTTVNVDTGEVPDYADNNAGEAAFEDLEQ